MYAGLTSTSKDATIVVLRRGVHWLTFLIIFWLMFFVGIGWAVLNNLLTRSPPLASPWWGGWLFIFLSATLIGIILSSRYNDKITISREGLTIYGARKTKNFKWSDFGGLRPNLSFDDVVLTYARGGYFGEAISREMAKAVLDYPARPTDWYLPPPILEYIRTGKVPKGVSRIGGTPTTEQTQADQSKIDFYARRMRNRSTAWVGLAISIVALVLIIVTLLFVR